MRLDREALTRELLHQDSLWREIVVVERAESTNADVAAAARDGAAEGLVITAEHQVAGRGRLGRVWTSPPRLGLAVSMLLRPDRVPSVRWPWLPLLAGTATWEAVTDAGAHPRLKWPNDVQVDGRKIAGILVERVESDAGPAAVVGIGLNVLHAADQLPVPEATSLRLCGASTTDRTAVLLALLSRIESRYLAWVGAAGDPEDSGLRQTYLTACDTIGRDVRVDLPDGSTAGGRAVGVDGSGRLEVESESGRRAFGAGDVVHLRSSS